MPSVSRALLMDLVTFGEVIRFTSNPRRSSPEMTRMSRQTLEARAHLRMTKKGLWVSQTQKRVPDSGVAYVYLW